jgi:hypothetical protein
MRDTISKIQEDLLSPWVPEGSSVFALIHGIAKHLTVDVLKCVIHN